MKVPHCNPGEWPAGIAASRLAARVRRDGPQGCRIGLIGLADDLGVRLNGGRPGAKEGPRAFRAALAKYGVADPAGWDWPDIFDAGDIVPAPGDDERSLHETHRRVTEAVSALLDAGLVPVGIGGGHDLTFPFVRAVAKKHPAMNGLYFDAHLDVRETAGSGMPFRKLIEECGVKRLDVFGLSEFANSREHVKWFKEHGGTIHAAGELGDEWPAHLPPGELFVSLDLDVIDASHAPGVSAMNPAGWSPAELEQWLPRVGRNTRVRCFDIMELNPDRDEQGRTARLAAHAFLMFARGLAERAP